MSNYILDLQARRITMLDARFYLTDDDSYVPSVTTVLEAYPKDYGYFQWLKSVGEDADAIRDEAGRRGSVVHELTERYDRGEEVTLLTESGNIGYKLAEWAMFERYVEFTQRNTPGIIATEQNYVSQAFGFAGTVDRIIDLAGRRYIIDIKTSNAVYPSYWLQLAAYKQLVQTEGDIDIDGVGILWLNAKTRTFGSKGQIQGPGWQLVLKTNEETASDWDLFKATHKLWLAQNEGVQPKKLSYTINHKK